MGDTHQENTATPSLKRWYKNPVYIVGGCVACVIFALVVAFAIHSLMLKRAHQMAEREDDTRDTSTNNIDGVFVPSL